jgi:hypothetical protein
MSPAGDIIGAVLAVFGLLGVPIAIFLRRRRNQRDDKGRGIIIAQYAPPSNLNLLEAAALIHREIVGISAQLVSLSVRGNIRLLDSGKQGRGKYTLQFVHILGTDELEGALLATLFTELVPGAALVAGATRELDADLPLFNQLSGIAHQARTAISVKRLVRPVSSTSEAAVGFTLFGLAAAEFLFLTLLSAIWHQTSVPGFIAIPITIVSAIVVVVMTVIRGPVLTPTGADQRDYLLGLREYLQLTEADRFRMFQSPSGAERIDAGDKTEVVKLYEKLLPFAVLWGIEEQWSNELAIRYDGGSVAPSWFVSSDQFNSAVFTAALSDLS